jgi:hypothetical protein
MSDLRGKRRWEGTSPAAFLGMDLVAQVTQPLSTRAYSPWQVAPACERSLILTEVNIDSLSGTISC